MKKNTQITDYKLNQLIKEHKFYKDELNKVINFLTEQLHPEYGPCDCLSKYGNCSVCIEVLEMLKSNYQQNYNK